MRRPTIPTIPAPARGAFAFGRELYIERDDFMENPPKKFFRLSPGARGAAALRLFHHLPRGGEECGRRGGRAALHLRSRDPRRQRAGRPQGAGDAALGCRRRMRVPAEVRLYNQLCSRAPIRTPPISPPISIRDRSRSSRRTARAGAGGAQIRTKPVQFERQGYFCRDRDSTPAACVQPHRRSARHLGESRRK